MPENQRSSAENGLPLKPVTAKVEQRVCYVPVTPYAIRFHFDNENYVGTYPGRPADGGPAYGADADGAAQDRFMLDNYLMWVEERTVYTVEPDPWEVVGTNATPHVKGDTRG